MRSPRELYEQAQQESQAEFTAPSPVDRSDAIRLWVAQRYHELMVAEGHIVHVGHEHAGGRDLPCGWPGMRLARAIPKEEGS